MSRKKHGSTWPGRPPPLSSTYNIKIAWFGPLNLRTAYSGSCLAPVAERQQQRQYFGTSIQFIHLAATALAEIQFPYSMCVWAVSAPYMRSCCLAWGFTCRSINCRAKLEKKSKSTRFSLWVQNMKVTMTTVRVSRGRVTIYRDRVVKCFQAVSAELDNVFYTQRRGIV